MEASNNKDELSGDTKALFLLRKQNYQYIQQLDWIAKKKDGEWVIYEIKDKELFTPGKNYPHYGAGLNKSQLFLRTQLYRDLGIRTCLLVFAKGTDDIYGAYLDELEKQGEFYDTPNEIRIYPIENFNKVETDEW